MSLPRRLVLVVSVALVAPAFAADLALPEPLPEDRPLQVGFVLAAAGLLDGRASTTFPGDVEAYRQMFPALDVREGRSFVHDGKALTSQGGARSYDVAMYLVDHIYGTDVAARVG